MDGLDEPKCIMGCKLDIKKEAIKLRCLHFICSDACASKLKLGSKKPGSTLCCTRCKCAIKEEQLKVKVVPDSMFMKKFDYSSVELKCDYCILNRVAVAYCPDCPGCLCAPCKELHPQTKATCSHNVQDDISEQKQKQRTTLMQEEGSCKDHDQSFIEYCEKCGCRICPMCKPLHKDHKTYDIERMRKSLHSKVDQTRQLLVKLDSAMQEIKDKHREIKTEEWINITKQIKEQFDGLIAVLQKRKNELQKEAQTRFFKQLAALNMRSKCAELSKATCLEFIQMAEDILKNKADVASIQFMNEYKEVFEWLDGLNSTMSSEYDRYVDKDWHFKLDLGATSQAQKFLSEYCQIEYTRSVNEANPIPIAPSSSSSNAGCKKTPSRRIAVKSTGIGSVPFQLNVNKSHAPKTYSRKNGNVSVNNTINADAPSPQLVERVTTGIRQVDIQDVDTESEEDEKSNQRNKRKEHKSLSKVVNRQDKDDTMEIDSHEDEARSEATTVGFDGDVASKGVGTEKNSRNSSPTVDSSNKLPPSSTTSRKREDVNEKLCTNVKSSVELEGMPILTASTCQLNEEVDKSADHTDTSSSKLRPAGASPESLSSVSESSELGLGKRERKKKAVPDGFLDTDESLKFLRKQQNAEAVASGRQQRKSGASKLNVTKVAKVQQNNKEDSATESNESSVRDVAEGDCSSVDIENNVDYESSDGNVSESGPSYRRHSLRKRCKVQAPDSPEAHLKKKPRAGSIGLTQNLFDDSAFREAPESSIETHPDLDMCDYPVMGGEVKMKVSSLDDNEDYCSICLDGGEEIIVCCDYCPKVFHLRCHIPVISEIPEGEAKWRCHCCMTKDAVHEQVASCPAAEGSDKLELDESNKPHFTVACKFVMECYKIREISTMRWVFPQGYKDKYGKVPFSMNYIRERLCHRNPEPFVGIEDMLLAFRQMFIQAFIFYKRKQKVRLYAVKCFDSFLRLINEYYPDYRDLFNDILAE